MRQGNSLNDLVYKNISDDIMDLTLEPGTTVSVQKLADMYGVSRTPVREAVIRLQKKDLVEIYPQAKTLIARINFNRIIQERFIRKALELAVVDDFIQNCNLQAFDAMENSVLIQIKCIGKKNYKEFFVADNEFHKIIFETANKDLAWATVNDVVSHYNRFRILSTKMAGIDQRIIIEHEKILKAAKDRNATGMKEILDAHLNKVQSQLGSLRDIYPQYFVDVR
jgi:GntR family transcriptional regulator, rspAB operon transcriptional repressor